MDRFEAVYPQDFIAVDDVLKFSYDSGYRFRISGFNSNALLLYDISAPAAVKRITTFASAIGDLVDQPRRQNPPADPAPPKESTDA